jgi:hypothetical protein
MCIPTKGREYIFRSPASIRIHTKLISIDNAKEFEYKNVTYYLSGISPPIKISFTTPMNMKLKATIKF